MKITACVAPFVLLFSAAGSAATPAVDIAALEAKFVAGLDARDAKLLDPLIADPFTWNGAQTQIFLASPTEEVVRNPGAGSLRFALDEKGMPVSASLVRADKELWRATRK